MIIQISFIHYIIYIYIKQYIHKLFELILKISTGSSLDTFKHCCGLGKNYATSGLSCTSFQTPIAGVEAKDEKGCLKYIDNCCKNTLL